MVPAFRAYRSIGARFGLYSYPRPVDKTYRRETFMEGAVIHQAVPEKDPRRHSWDYLELIGVSPLPPRT